MRGLDQGGGRADREEEGGAGLHFEVGLRGCSDLLLGWIRDMTGQVRGGHKWI